MSVFKTPIVFINYRRNDSKSEARNLNNDLENAFGKGFVFRDLDDIRSGTIWIDKLKEAGSDAKVILAVIGPDWLQKNEEGKSRLDDPKDWVRKELEQAIADKKKIIPVLVKGALLPEKATLPNSLHPLFDHQYFELRDDKWNLDLPALIKDISDLSDTKTKVQKANEEKEKISQEKEARSKKKILWMSAGMVALLVVLFGYIFWPRHEEPPTRKPQTSVATDGSTTNDDQGLTSGREKPKAFCPKFESNANIKTLLYPLEIKGQDINIGHIIKQKIANICASHSIESEVKTPNIEEGKFYDAQDAKRKCETCTSDIFLTGICYAESPAKYGLSANIGFCDPIYQGFDLDQDKLSIEISDYTIGDLISDSNMAESFEYTIEILLGIHQIKKGNLEEGIKIIQKAIIKYPLSKALEKEAREILWQAQYKLGKKPAASATLGAIFELDQNNIRPLILKSDLDFKIKNYDEAIQGLNLIIAKKPKTKDLDRLLERRADSYYEVKQYDKAKADYKSIKTYKVDRKIRDTDRKIISNNQQISNLTATPNLTASDKSKLVNLYTQNGEYSKASEVFTSIPSSQFNTPEKMEAIGINISTINALQESKVNLTPAIKNSFQKAKTAQKQKIIINNN